MERNLLGAFLLCTIPAIALFLQLAGLSLDVHGAMPTLGSCCAGIVAGQLYRPGKHRQIDALVAAVETLSLLSTVTIVGGIASYVAARESVGFVDAQLSAIDLALGFDWPAYWAFVTTRPLILGLLNIGYKSIFFFPAVVIPSLMFAGMARRAYGFVLAWGLALVLTITTYVFTPAKSAALFYLGAGYPNLPTPGVLHVPIIEALRSGVLRTIPLAQLDGLITFPSFHASYAILAIWAAWPCSWLRWPALFLNLLTLCATPICGGHYFIDVLGGALVSMIAVACVSNLGTWRIRDFAPDTRFVQVA